MRSIQVIAAALVLLATPAAEAKFARQTLDVPGSILWVTSGDLDGDGKTDLAVSYRRGSGPSAGRFIGVFFRGDKGYAGRPDVAFAVPQNAAAFDLGDVFGDGQDEVVYLMSSGVFAQPFSARKPGNPTRLITTPTLVVEPEEEDLVAWDFVRKLGSETIAVLPGRRNVRIFRREGEAWKSWSDVDITKLSFYDAESATYRRSGRGGRSGRPYAFRVTTIVPNIDFVDQTGDGKVDVVTHYEDRIAVHPMTADGTFSKRPAKRQWFNVLTKSERESRDVGISAQIVDVDQDGIADLCLSKIGGGITTLKTEVRLYKGKKGGGFDRKPTQVFDDDGFASLVRFVDVDGDGKLEMLHPHSEVSIMSMSSAMLSSKVSLDVRIRRQGTDGDLFDRKPVQTLETSFGLDLTVGAALRGTAPIFGHDFDGDGRKDVIMAQGGDKMVLHRGLKKGGDMFEEEGRISLSAPGTSTTLALPPRADGTGRPDLLVYYVARKDLTGRLYVFLNRS